MYTLAVAFMLFVLDAGHVSRSYVLMSYFGYLCYVLAVLTADFHHRGWLPYQRGAARRGRSAWRGGGVGARGVKAGARVRGARSPRSPHGVRGGVSKAKGGGGKAARAGVVAGSLPRDALASAHVAQQGFEESMPGMSSSQDLSSGPMVRGGDVTVALPVSAGPGMATGANGAEQESSSADMATSHTFEHLSIDSVRASTTPAASASAAVAAAAERAQAAATALAAPLRCAQTWSIPCAPHSRESPVAASAHGPLALSVLVKCFLACQVQALYLRTHLTLHSWLWLSIASGCGIVASWAVLACITHLPHVRARHAFEPAGRRARSILDPDDQMVAIEESRSRDAQSPLPPPAPTSLPSPTIPAEPSQIPQVENDTYDSSAHAAVLHAALEPIHTHSARCEPAHTGPLLASRATDATPATPSSPFERVATRMTEAGLNVAAFVASIIWIQLVAEELVALLDFLGSVLSIDHTLLGITLLAWGAF